VTAIVRGGGMVSGNGDEDSARRRVRSVLEFGNTAKNSESPVGLPESLKSPEGQVPNHLRRREEYSI
jgi:hypothetical protein